MVTFVKTRCGSGESCLLTLYTAVMSFEILFPFGLWVSEPGWLLSTTVSWCGGVPVSLKLLFKLGVGAVRQSILARIILCCVCMCVMHVFGSTRAIWRHLLLVMSYCHRPRTFASPSVFTPNGSVYCHGCDIEPDPPGPAPKTDSPPSEPSCSTCPC